MVDIATALHVLSVLKDRPTQSAPQPTPQPAQPVGRAFMVDITKHNNPVGRGFSPTRALKTPQYIDVANNDKGAEFKDSVGLKTDLHFEASDSIKILQTP